MSRINNMAAKGKGCLLAKWCVNRGFICFRTLSVSRHISPDILTQKYNQRKANVEGKRSPLDVPPTAIFANNETALSDVDVYGFDYDYTLASYKPSLHRLIYNMATEYLISKLKYPPEIASMVYDPKFAERGLHFDIYKGLLLKIDSFHHIQLGTVYRGLQPVPDDEVKALYDGTHVSLDNLKSFHDSGSMHQLLDLFAIPEISLISNVIEYLNQQNTDYDPEYVFYDVRAMVQTLHTSGTLHEAIISNLDLYLDKSPELIVFFQQLLKSDKKLFLISNSGFPFIDAGMKYLIGGDWREIFDVIIVNARKPKFFNGSTRPFRTYDDSHNKNTWDRVDRLIKGQIYIQGNFYLFRQMTGWFGPKVLYFGDHVYTDLADPSMRHGWKTGAIIPELEEEITMLNKTEYKAALMWSLSLQDLIHDAQDLINDDPQDLIHDAQDLINDDPQVWALALTYHRLNTWDVLGRQGHYQRCGTVKGDNTREEARLVVKQWIAERDNIRLYTKSLFNPQFGSIFRTHHNPTFFTRRLSRFADIYTSKITNLLQYSNSHTFYPRRFALPHESYPRN